MKHARIAGLAAVITVSTLVLAGCGSSGSGSNGSNGAGDGSSPTASAATTAAAALTEADLPGALLTLADVPKGFKVDTEADDDDLTLSGCKAVDEFTERTKDESSKDASFTAGESGPFASETLTLLGDSDVAAEFAEGQAAYAACPTITIPATDTGGQEVELKLKVTPVSGLGDEAFRIKGAATIEDVPLDLEVNYIRVGNTVIEIDNFAIGAADNALTTSLSEKAVAKVKQAQSA